MHAKILSQFGLGRIVKIKIKNKIRLTPIFVPALSSASKTQEFLRAKRWLINTQPYEFLISAYDFDSEFQQLFPTSESFVILDSGGYELQNLKNPKPWNINSFMKVIPLVEPDIVISLDNYGMKFEKSVAYYKKIKEKFSTDIVVEFVINTHNLKELRNHIIKALETIQPSIIAIPEINLGSSFRERISNIKNISELIQSMEEPILLHLLGCSDPESIIEYSFNGVDIFDGLGWNRYVININGQEFRFTNFAKLPKECPCYVCQNVIETSYSDRVLNHNILAYYNLMEKIREQIIDGSEF